MVIAISPLETPQMNSQLTPLKGEKTYLYRFLEEAQQDEISAEVNFRTLVKEKLQI